MKSELGERPSELGMVILHVASALYIFIVLLYLWAFPFSWPFEPWYAGKDWFSWYELQGATVSVTAVFPFSVESVNDSCNVFSHRSNLDPFNQYSEEQIWDALERTHMKECVSMMHARKGQKPNQGGEKMMDVSLLATSPGSL